MLVSERFGKAQLTGPGWRRCPLLIVCHRKSRTPTAGSALQHHNFLRSPETFLLCLLASDFRLLPFPFRLFASG
jgi:hypothetical protein